MGDLEYYVSTVTFGGVAARMVRRYVAGTLTVGPARPRQSLNYGGDYANQQQRFKTRLVPLRLITEGPLLLSPYGRNTASSLRRRRGSVIFEVRRIHFLAVCNSGTLTLDGTGSLYALDGRRCPFDRDGRFDGSRNLLASISASYHGSVPVHSSLTNIVQ